MKSDNRLNTVAIMLGLIFLLNTNVAQADNEPCTKDGLCANGSTYFKLHGRIYFGNNVRSVDEVHQTAEVSYLVNGTLPVVKVPLKDVAIVKPGACLDAAKNLCNGEPYYIRNGAGKMELRILSAYFLSTRELVELKPNGDPSVRSARLVITASLPSTAHSFADLIQRIKTGVPLFLNDFVDSLKISDSDLTSNAWNVCKNRDYYGFPLQVDKDNMLLPKCQPDTLYSWGSIQKIKRFAKQIGNGPWSTNPFEKDALYTAESPISSFGYGSKAGTGGYAVRIKLKKGTQFAVFEDGSMPDCSSLPADQNKITVYVRVVPMEDDRGLEFDLCSAEPIESWSYGMPEFYRELTMDLARALSPNYGDDFLSYIRTKDDSGVYHPNLWNTGPDEQDFDKAALINEYKDLAAMVERQQGMIFYNSDVKVDNASKRAQHFSSVNDMWFHH